MNAISLTGRFQTFVRAQPAMSRMWLFHLSLVLVVASGCYTPVIAPPTLQSASAYKLVENIAGVRVAIEPITDPKEVTRRFSVNILELDILPVFVVATNEQQSAGCVISAPQFALINGTRQLSGGDVRNANFPPDYGRGFRTGGIAGGVSGGLLGMWFTKESANFDSTVLNQYIRHEKLAAKSLLPGAGTHGYLYFRLPKKEERQPIWTVLLEVVPTGTSVTNNVLFQFDWNANKGIK